jgi:hypothetical protein
MSKGETEVCYGIVYPKFDKFIQLHMPIKQTVVSERSAAHLPALLFILIPS